MGIFSDLKPRNKANRNGFDLSRRVVFSNKMGVIRPVLQIPTLPSSEYEIDMAQLMRTQPLQRAAFTGLSVNYDFIFVPYNHLYSSFNQFIAQRDCKELANQPDSDSIPSFNLKAFLNVLIPLAALDYLLCQVTDEQWQMTKWRGSEQDFYIDNFPRYLVLSNSNQSYSLLLSSISMLDMLGYGNFLPLVKQVASCLIEKLDYDVLQQTFPAVPSWCNKTIWYVVNLIKGKNIFEEVPNEVITKIMYVWENNYGVDFIHYLMSFDKSFSLWPALAYNKCFYEYYRNTYYDENYVVHLVDVSNTLVDPENVRDNPVNLDYVQLFNLDDTPNFSSVDSDEAAMSRLLAIFSEKLHQYKRDMFTGVLPSTQFGNVSTMVTDTDFRKLFYTDVDLGSSLVGRNNTPGSAGIYPIGTNGIQISNTGTNKYFSAKFALEPGLAISVLEARKADAMQRFKERMLRAGNKTKDIFEAHGWDRPKSQSAFEPVFLGSYDGNMDINVVAATAESNDVELGQLAANGVCVVKGHKIRVKTSDFGVILCVQYLVKSAEYDAYGVDKAHCNLEAFDFPYPELQNISLVPITQEVLNHVSPVGGINPPSPASYVLGYLPRSFEYKTAVDSVHGEFYGSNFIGYSQPSVGAESLKVSPIGVFADWVTTRKNTFAGQANKVAFHYIQIDCLDNIFKQRCTSDPATDPFLFNVQFDVKAVEPLPVIGLPI